MISLYDLFEQGKTISANTPVKLPISSKATIYGFVPYDIDISDVFDGLVICPPLGQAQVVCDRIMFNVGYKQQYRYPIYDKVSKPKEKQYPLDELYVMRFIESKYKQDYKKYISQQIIRYSIRNVEEVQVVDKKAYYSPRSGDRIFESSSGLKGIGNAFVVITRRVSTENGMIVYEVFNPNEVEVIE